MFCPSCGKPLDLNARFCSNCGARMTPVPPATMSQTSRLVRPRYPRLIAGVCAGFAEHYGWDLSVVRVVTVLLAILTSGIGFVAYLAAWIIIPEGAYTLPQTTGSSTI